MALLATAAYFTAGASLGAGAGLGAAEGALATGAFDMAGSIGTGMLAGEAAGAAAGAAGAFDMAGSVGTGMLAGEAAGAAGEAATAAATAAAPSMLSTALQYAPLANSAMSLAGMAGIGAPDAPAIPSVAQAGAPAGTQVPKQSALTADYESIRKQKQAALADIGAGSTFLTGPGGIGNSSLNMGRTTLGGSSKLGS